MRKKSGRHPKHTIRIQEISGEVNETPIKYMIAKRIPTSRDLYSLARIFDIKAILKIN